MNNSSDNHVWNLVFKFVQWHRTTSLRFDPIDNFFSKSRRPIKLPWRNQSIVVRIHGREPSRRSFCYSKLPRIRKIPFLLLNVLLMSNILLIRLLPDLHRTITVFTSVAVNRRTLLLHQTIFDGHCSGQSPQTSRHSKMN